MVAQMQSLRTVLIDNPRLYRQELYVSKSNFYIVKISNLTNPLVLTQSDRMRT
jgi:hypothetical protein